MSFTTGNGTGFVTTKPAVTGANTAENWFSTTGDSGQGTPVPADFMNDLLDNIRQAATDAGVDLTTATRGANTLLRDIIQNLGGLNIRINTSSAGVNAPDANAGPRPIVVFDNQWVAMQTGVATSAVNDLPDKILSLQSSTVAANTLLKGIFAGQFTCTLANVSSTGGYTDASISTADRGKAVYLHTTGAGYRYALEGNIHADQRGNIRHIGTLINTSGTTHTVFFNTLQQQPQARVRLLWTGNAYSGTENLVTGVNFLDYAFINVSGGQDRTLSGFSARTTIQVYVPEFAAGQRWGIQESHAADGFWDIGYTSPTSFDVRSRAGNLSAGVTRIWGIK